MNNVIPHPQNFIPSDVAERLHNAAFDAENAKTLHDNQLSAIFESNWFNMFVPRNLGGLELSLPEIIRIEEGISWADGSSGWVVTLCSGAAWFVGFLDPVVSMSAFNSQHVCFAGSGAVNGTANRTTNGYEINGFWPYATGCLLATAFTVNCLVQEKGVQLYDSEGNPLVRSFLLMPHEVKIHRTWHAMGMVSTGSHSIEVKTLTIPENRSFIIDPKHAILPDIIFRYPFLQLAESTLTANLSGLAGRFLDLSEIKLTGRSNGFYARKIGETRSKLQDARERFYSGIDTAWISLVAGKSVSEALLSQVTVTSRDLVECCTEIVSALYPLCGLEAADTRQEINRVWRNFQTAIQHNLFRGFRQESQLFR